MGFNSKLTVLLITAGTVLAASAGSFLIEQFITWEWGTAGIVGSLVLLVGAVVFWSGTRRQANHARRLGVFMSAFAIGPWHEPEKVAQETATFSAWATKLNPLARVLPPTTMPVNNSRDMELFQDRIKNGLLHAESLVAGGPDLTLKVGGRLDACFYLGAALRNTTGVTGRVWVVSDCSIEYADDFSSVARFATNKQTVVRHGDEDRERAPMQRQAPIWVDSEQGLVAVPVMTFNESQARSELFCRNDDRWTKCEHSSQHQTVIVAFDPQHFPTPDNRVSRQLDMVPHRFGDTVLAYTGMEGLGATFASYTDTLEKVERSAERARAAATPRAGLFVVLLGPPAFSVALGARLSDPSSPWQSLAFRPGKDYVPSPLRPAKSSPTIS